MKDTPPDEIDLFLSSKSTSEVREMLKQKLEDIVTIQNLSEEFIHDKAKLSDPVKIVYDLVQQIEFLQSQNLN